MNDHIYAKPKIIEVKPGNVNHQFNFEHIFSALTVTIRQTAVRNSYNIPGEETDVLTTLRRIKIETVDSTAWIPVKGYYSGVDGTITKTDSIITVDYKEINSSSNGSHSQDSYWEYTLLLVPEIPVEPTEQNRKLKLTLYYGYYYYYNSQYNREEELMGGSIILDLAKFKTNTNPALYGMRRGYKYYMQIDVDDFFKIKKFEMPPAKPWESETINIKI